jgi:hypothetical protein
MWGIGLRWLRDGKVVEDYHILHGSEETDEYRLSPIRATIERGTPLQRRLDRPVLGSRAQGVFGRASPAHDRPAKGSHATCMGVFLSSGCFWVLLPVLCSERERPFFVL